MDILGSACHFLLGFVGFFMEVATRHTGAWSVYIMGLLPLVIIFIASFVVSRMRAEWSLPALSYAFIGGLVGTLGTIAFYQALARGPVAQSVALTALYPGVTLVLAILVLKEHISFTQVTGIALAIVAGYLMTR